MSKKRIVKIGTSVRPPEKLNAAAYCRVSTASDQQLISLKDQKFHYQELISRHKDWNLVGIYYEEGISGTGKEDRPELQRMLADCAMGKIDLILTKSISRFARNTTDCLEMVRQLSGFGVNIFFEKENLSTGSMEGEFLLTVLSSLAEEESRSISANEIWSIRKRFETGTFRYSKAPFGYDLADGTFVISGNEAATVRWIFREFLSGEGTSRIAQKLNQRNIRTKEGGRWFSKTIYSMITNIAYTGDILMQKTFTDDHFKRIVNRGQKNQYYMDHHHPALIDRTAFDSAQILLKQRATEYGRNAKNENQHHYCFTGKLRCDYCGNTLRRVTQSAKSGKRYHWSCSTHLRNRAACPRTRVQEEDIKNAFMTMINKLYYSISLILDNYVIQLANEETAGHQQRLAAIHDSLNRNNEKRQKLNEHLSKSCVEPIHFRQEMIRLEEESQRLKEERILLLKRQETVQEARSFQHFVARFARKKNQTFPEEAFTRYVDQVVIHSAERYTFCLKCGLYLTEDISDHIHTLS